MTERDGGGCQAAGTRGDEVSAFVTIDGARSGFASVGRVAGVERRRSIDADRRAGGRLGSHRLSGGDRLSGGNGRSGDDRRVRS
jgi:hypothetical protein